MKGAARFRASAGPPAMTARVPRSAPSEPPDTGASTQSTPSSAAWPAKSLVATGEIVEWSTIRSPSVMPWMTPKSPNTTSSTSGVSETQTKTMSLSGPTS